ncbi:MAG: adenylyltransferase/cytidyltransferase family protein [Lentisphaeria bacterium]|nr:adenylyltransferase/cytidyltransferase family protein [Lentisphaeria bacterium]NQZ69039.1 adenylyltransferase/cytidyltransferase family protein [Lentisphaeria bacterium]
MKSNKIYSIEDVIEWRQKIRDKGETLVMTNGCFDLIHPGHVHYMTNASAMGDHFLVAVNGDQSLENVKGSGRPIIDEAGRTFLIASLTPVSAVVVFNTDDCVEILRQICPDIYVKGGDYTIETINQDERKVIDELGIKIEFLAFVTNYSTSSIINKIKLMK